MVGCVISAAKKVQEATETGLTTSESFLIACAIVEHYRATVLKRAGKRLTSDERVSEIITAAKHLHEAGLDWREAFPMALRIAKDEIERIRFIADIETRF